MRLLSPETLFVSDAICASVFATINSKSGNIRGCAAFAGGSVTRSVVGGLSFNATITGMNCGNMTVCPFISSALANYGLIGSCAFDAVANGCVCSLTKSLNVTGGDPYTTSGNQFTLTDAGRVFDYCATGNNLTYHEVTPSSGSSFRDPGYFGMAKQ